MKRLLLLAAATALSVFSGKSQSKMTGWMGLSEVPEHIKTQVVPVLWADYPRLNARTSLVILEAAGPGVITQIHASAFGTGFGKGFDSPASQGVMIRVFYDGY